jgi:glycosyltransferase involved in cell wall biosynthesis
MRVAIFTDTYRPQINGVTNTIDKMTQQFDLRGIKYRIYAPQYESEPDCRNIERFYSLKFFLYPECRVALPNVFRIIASLNEFKPDLIHLMTEFNLGLTGLNYALKNKIPVISNYSTNFSQYTDYYKIELLKNGVWSYMEWFHNQCKLTTCPSQATQTTLKEHRITNTAIFSRGIDAERFSPQKRDEMLRKDLGLADKVVFLYVGRVAVEKDMDILRKSYRQVEHRNPGQVALVVTGDGPMLEECKRTFPASTLFTGFKKGEELARLYGSCDIFVCPSSTETFGNVVLEAMASGLAVIGANAGGVGEIIHTMNNGLTFEVRSVSSLTKAMELLLANVELREQLQFNGRRTALLRGWNEVINRLLTSYADLLGQLQEKAEAKLHLINVQPTLITRSNRLKIS